MSAKSKTPPIDRARNLNRAARAWPAFYNDIQKSHSDLTKAQHAAMKPAMERNPAINARKPGYKVLPIKYGRGSQQPAGVHRTSLLGAAAGLVSGLWRRAKQIVGFNAA